MIFKENAMSHLAYLKRRLSQTKKSLSSLPSGSMIIKESRGKKYYYIKKHGKLRNLKSDPQLICSYLKKKDLLKDKKTLEANIKMLDKTIYAYIPLAMNDTSWNDSLPNQNRYKIEEKQHLYNGIYYRSKSEAAIAALLTSYSIPFKYETLMTLNGFPVYPDFLIKRPKDGKIFVWEHFGLVSSEPYLHKTFNKLNNYHNAGYNLWDNLLISFDQEDGSFNIDTIDKIIQLFLL